MKKREGACTRVTTDDIKRIKKEVAQTNRTNKERGFFKCTDKTSPSCVGDKCSLSHAAVEWVDICERHEREYFIHTHPIGRGKDRSRRKKYDIYKLFSDNDLKFAVREKIDSCIAFKQGKKTLIRCIRYKDLENRFGPLWKDDKVRRLANIVEDLQFYRQHPKEYPEKQLSEDEYAVQLVTALRELNEEFKPCELKV